jgi:hypothetical protein
LLVKDAQLKDVGLAGSVLLLLLAGLIACWIWRSLLLQYGVLLDWWYGRLRELEAALPGSAQIVTREYNELYAASRDKAAGRLSMTKRELMLIWIFIGLYTVFALGILIDFLV